MTTDSEQERAGLFARGDPRHVDPRLLLLDNLLEKLPDRSARIESIKSVLERPDVWDGFHSAEAVRLVDVLEGLFTEEPYKDALGFRAYLRELSAARSMLKPSRTYYNEQDEVAAGLHLAILGKILAGWRWERVSRGWLRLELSAAVPSIVQDVDAGECFRFVCRAYNRAPAWRRFGDYPNPEARKDPGEIRAGILALLAEHLVPKEGRWSDAGLPNATELDAWILREGTATAVVEVLLEARDRIGGLALRRRELEILQTR